jgi:hypothetical protein
MYFSPIDIILLLITDVMTRMDVRPSTEYINSVKSLVQAAKADVKEIGLPGMS